MIKLKKKSNEKIQQKPNIKNETKKKTKTKKFGQAKHVGLGGPVCLDLKKNPRGDLYD
jgi:hypothetical protein